VRRGNKMVKEILRIRYVENGETKVNFSMEFRKWRRMHRKGGGCPFFVPTNKDKWDDGIKVTLQSEEKDAIAEGNRIQRYKEKEENEIAEK